MVWSLEGTSAICLAASKGLGLGIAKEMALAGARTLLVSRTKSDLEDAAAEIAATIESEGTYPGVGEGHRPLVLAADLKDTDSFPRIAQTAAERFGGIDILVNNIGGPSPGTFDSLDAEAWQDGYDQLIKAYAEQFRAALPWLEKSGSARVLTVTSVSARQPIPGLLLSNTFRAGLVGMTKTLAQEYASRGILINNLAPGMFDTDRLLELDEITSKNRGISLDEVRRERQATIPIGRYGDPRELGKAAVFLASPANTMITGQTILVDGGVYKGL